MVLHCKWRLTLSEVMSAIAVLAVAFACMSPPQACTLAMVVVISMAIDGST
jgi:hypothetical protein